MITVENLTKRFGSRTVVNQLTFTIRSGLVTGFLGPNGAGKSTTMRMIVGLVHPSEGHALIDGRPYRSLRRPTAKVGVMLEAQAVQGYRTGAEHLLWQARIAGVARSRVAQTLELVGLSDAADRRVGGYSLGMWQRLALAGALLADPPVLILDEPINGLDAEGILWMRETLRGFAAMGRTVFVSSHLMDEMQRTADRVVIINQGQFIQDVSVSELTARTTTEKVVVRSAANQRLGRILAQHGASVATQQQDLEVCGLAASEIGRLALDAGIALSELRPEHMTLEEAFLAATGQPEASQESLR